MVLAEQHRHQLCERIAAALLELCADSLPDFLLFLENHVDPVIPSGCDAPPLPFTIPLAVTLFPVVRMPPPQQRHGKGHSDRDQARSSAGSDKKNSRFLIVKIGLGLYIMPEDRRGKNNKGVGCCVGSVWEVRCDLPC